MLKLLGAAAGGAAMGLLNAHFQLFDFQTSLIVGGIAGLVVGEAVNLVTKVKERENDASGQA